MREDQLQSVASIRLDRLSSIPVEIGFLPPCEKNPRNRPFQAKFSRHDEKGPSSASVGMADYPYRASPIRKRPPP